ncbi:Histone-lysine N-methyltransferase EZH2 [Phytophthora cinnamomi]|uniref:Histone-lysine N-methyltransferase EZH2 n=1 Tax=Phytophthora cinnamomi TaxID=4785 RepID=UPI00355AC201|nr:Histone-lysine N-methyltransferase EZH2 [Phytophthora cinnamomi]
MGKSSDRNVTAEQEFASLEKMLNQTADDATRCLKLLKKNLSEYDSRHGNHFVNTATSYLRSDMRTAKDTSADLKHVAHQINKSHQPSESEVISARNMMGATAKAMDVLKTTARNYDQKSGRSTGVKGVIGNVVGGNDHKDKEANAGGLFGNKGSKDEHKDDKHTGLFNKGDKHKDKDKESKGVAALFGKNDDKDKESKGGGLFSKSDKHKDDKHTGLFGSKDKDKDANHGDGLLGNKGDHYHNQGGGGILASSNTVEELVKATLRDNFNLSTLSHQITIAEKSLSASPSFVERAKEAVNEVKDKLKGDKSSSPTHDGHHGHKDAVTP